ncbi:MAG: DUF1304 domain-containing protein [Microbacterium sp.]|uniref:DUF1304 domain-containing protein n=1 Tax=Microbacterium sp. TaxID=51671 RepID=UPI0039E41A5A
MLITGLVVAGIAALIHVYIFVLESVRWRHPRTRAIFGIRSDEEARVTAPLAFNQGFYNLFLAVATALGILFAAVGSPTIGVTLVFAGTGSMLAAGVVLVVSSPSRARAALVQAVAPLLAIVLLVVALVG